MVMVGMKRGLKEGEMLIVYRGEEYEAARVRRGYSVAGHPDPCEEGYMKVDNPVVSTVVAAACRRELLELVNRQGGPHRSPIGYASPVLGLRPMRRPRAPRR